MEEKKEEFRVEESDDEEVSPASFPWPWLVEDGFVEGEAFDFNAGMPRSFRRRDGFILPHGARIHFATPPREVFGLAIIKEEEEEEEDINQPSVELNVTYVVEGEKAKEEPLNATYSVVIEEEKNKAIVVEGEGGDDQGEDGSSDPNETYTVCEGQKDLPPPKPETPEILRRYRHIRLFGAASVAASVPAPKEKGRPPGPNL